MYKIKHKNGQVNALLKSGSTFTVTTIPLDQVHEIIEVSELVDSDRSDYLIYVECLDMQWYFEREDNTKNNRRKEKGE